MHVLHVSTAGGVELIRRARERGVRVTAEVCPHHLALTDKQSITVHVGAQWVRRADIPVTQDDFAAFVGLEVPLSREFRLVVRRQHLAVTRQCGACDATEDIGVDRTAQHDSIGALLVQHVIEVRECAE